MHTLNELEALTLIWSKERGIIDNGKAETQALKLIEELGETIGCILKKKNPKDGIGDCMVVLCNLSAICGIQLTGKLPYGETTSDEHNRLFYLTILSGILGMAILEQEKEDIDKAINMFYYALETVASSLDTTIEECWNLAYEEIKDRKGYLTSEGNFIKESDNV